jgi:hypothetical protein
VREQGADGGLRRRNGDVDLAALQQVYVGAAVDERDHLTRPHALREQRAHDVVLVVVGECAEDVHVADVLLLEQLLVGDIADKHERPVELGGKPLGLGFVELDDLDVVAVSICRARRRPMLPPPPIMTRLPACPCAAARA